MKFLREGGIKCINGIWHITHIARCGFCQAKKDGAEQERQFTLDTINGFTDNICKQNLLNSLNSLYYRYKWQMDRK